MNKTIESLKSFRLFTMRQVEKLTAAQLNTVPQGHNNSIAWNFGHLLSAQQTMCYVRAGLPLPLPAAYLAPFASGTTPQRPLSLEEIDALRAMLISSLDILDADYGKNLFQSYTPSAGIRQVYGVEVTNIDEALSYLLYHEGLHAGYIFSLKRAVV